MSDAQQERRLIVAAAAAHALVHICELSFPTIMVVISEDLLHNAKAYNKMGFASFIGALVFGVVSLPAGLLCDRIGQRRMILVYLFGAAASLVLLGFANNYVMLVAALALMMGFIGAYHPAGTSLLSVGTRRRGIAMGWHGVGGSIGLRFPRSARAVSRSGWAGGTHSGCSGFFRYCLASIFFWTSGLESASEPAIAPEEIPTHGKNKIMLLPILFLFTMAILNGMCYRGFTTFLPAYFKTEIKGELLPGFPSLLQAGSFMTLVLFIGIFGQLLGGKLADKYREEFVYTTVFLVSAPLLFLVGLLHGGATVASAMVFAFFYFTNQSVGNTIIPRFVPEGRRGHIYGWFFLVNFSGGSIMSWIAGMVAMRFSLSSIFVLLAGVLFAAGMTGFLLIAASRSAQEQKI